MGERLILSYPDDYFLRTQLESPLEKLVLGHLIRIVPEDRTAQIYLPADLDAVLAFIRGNTADSLRTGYTIIPQVRVRLPDQPEGPRYFKVDFVIAVSPVPGPRNLPMDRLRLFALECDGKQYHGDERFDYDLARERVLECKGLEVIHVGGTELHVDATDTMNRVAKLFEVAIRIERRQYRYPSEDLDDEEETRPPGQWLSPDDEEAYDRLIDEYDYLRTSLQHCLVRGDIFRG